MKSGESTELRLPPGLYLPTAEEDPERFRSDHFDGQDLEQWRAVDFGSFVVALAAFDTDRTSLMPTRTDLEALRHAGYGPSLRHIQNVCIGISGLQLLLGFCPKGYQPDKSFLIERYRKIAQKLDREGHEFDDGCRIREIIEWCSARRLAPKRQTVYPIFKHSIDEVRAIFGRQETSSGAHLRTEDLYRFGARVIAENDGIVPNKILEEKYPNTLGIRPNTAAREFFGGHNRFWLEFDRVTDTTSLSEQDLVNLATRLAIRTGNRDMSRTTVRTHASMQQLPSEFIQDRRPGGLPVYRERVQADLAVFDSLSQELEQMGCSPKAIRAFCNRFEPNAEFRNWLLSGANVIAKLSKDTRGANYALGLIANGLDLLDENTYADQLADLLSYLRGVGIKGKRNIYFVLKAVPRLDPDEAMEYTA